MSDKTRLTLHRTAKQAGELIADQQAEIERLRAALRPFADFGRNAPWPGTVWENKPDTTPVLHDNNSNRDVTLDDFYVALEAMEDKS